MQCGDRLVTLNEQTICLMRRDGERIQDMKIMDSTDISKRFLERWCDGEK
jgi:hypothetical protein